MRAHVITQFGGPNVFETIGLPKPVIKPGHVIIRVHASSVNPIDCKIRGGGPFAAIAPVFPAVLHGDVAGVIEEVGSDITHFKVGDKVYGCAGGIVGNGGALAEYMLADVRLIAHKPHSLSMAEAAALPLVSITAWEALMDKVRVQPGQQVLVHAGTGGVGHIGVQLAKWAGARVCTTVPDDKKSEIAKSLGADETINYQSESVTDYVQRLTQGKGFDVVFDTVGGANLSTSLAAIGFYGNVVTTQARSENDLSPLHAKSGSLHSVFMLLPLIHDIRREHHGEILQKLATIVDEGKLKPLIDSHQFAFDDVAKAHAFLESGQAVGKVVLTQN